MSESDPMDPGKLTGFIIPRVDGGDDWAWSIENAPAEGEQRPKTSLLFDFDEGSFATEPEAEAAMLRAAKHAHRRLGELIARLEGEAAADPEDMSAQVRAVSQVARLGNLGSREQALLKAHAALEGGDAEMAWWALDVEDRREIYGSWIGVELPSVKVIESWVDRQAVQRYEGVGFEACGIVCGVRWDGDCLCWCNDEKTAQAAIRCEVDRDLTADLAPKIAYRFARVANRHRGLLAGGGR